jgi:nucleoside-diphosphate-sugar epimerase
MSESRIVLVTGSAGRIGQAVVRALKAGGWRVRGFDLAPTAGADESLVGDIAEGTAIRQAAHGADALIHLAAIPDDDDFLTKLMPANAIGVYHVLEAARLGGVPRLVLGSSGQVVWWQRYTGPLPIGVDVQPTPRAWYAALKVFLEAAGRAYAESHHISVLAVRLGWCPRTAEHAAELDQTEWGPDVYLSPRDAGRFFACALEPLTDTRFAVVYACSRHARQEMYDMRPAKELLGYEPQDTWPEGLD